DDSLEAKQEAHLTIAYRPPVPQLDQLALEPQSPITRPGAGGDPFPVLLSGRIIGTPEHHPLDEAVVLIDDEPLDTPPLVVRLAGNPSGTLTARVPLTRGSHRIHVAFRNRWKDRALFEPLQVISRR